jgi:hypothetical protein
MTQKSNLSLMTVEKLLEAATAYTATLEKRVKDSGKSRFDVLTQDERNLTRDVALYNDIENSAEKERSRLEQRILLTVQKLLGVEKADSILAVNHVELIAAAIAKAAELKERIRLSGKSVFNNTVTQDERNLMRDAALYTDKENRTEVEIKRLEHRIPQTMQNILLEEAKTHSSQQKR